MIWNKNRKPGRPRSSHIVSQFLRPLFEWKRTRLVVGMNLAASILIVQSLGPIGGAITGDVETAILSPQTIQVLTETTFRNPLETNLGYSQGFHRFHPGVDIRAPRGTLIYPAADGLIVEIENGRFGYGHKVLVAHANGVLTLYAHLGEIRVEVGNEVTKDTAIGVVGMTGWTTGPHLHFEIRGPEGLINPKQVLPDPVSS